MEAARNSRLDAQQRRKVRDEILSEMERVYQRMQVDKEELRKRMLADKEELRKRIGELENTQEATEKALEWTNERVAQFENDMEKLEKTTAEAVRKAEEQASIVVKGMEKRMDLSAKHLQGITHAVIGGFGMILLAVLLLFITLLVKI